MRRVGGGGASNFGITCLDERVIGAEIEGYRRHYQKRVSDIDSAITCYTPEDGTNELYCINGFHEDFLPELPGFKTLRVSQDSVCFVPGNAPGKVKGFDTYALFVTDGKYTGADIGGQTGADEICNAEATEAGGILGVGDYVAVFDKDDLPVDFDVIKPMNPVHPTYFRSYSGGFVFPDHTQVRLVALMVDDTQIDTFLMKNQYSEYIDELEEIWVKPPTLPQHPYSSPYYDDCNGWSSDEGYGGATASYRFRLGESNILEGWKPGACDTPRRILCVTKNSVY